ncbi:hypothetical protein [Enterovibrio norvegicus]|uniref:hypothetical protein n=1 Tax=Enterovibrio norvegicus TaxID=188144 RepID=UPI000C851DC9|nr:hypothetical protein [Enterovibrio norvegicus]PMH66551.1 hypothetical protein BCU62_09390 [Enterovibrio norvegicus]
MKIQKYLVLLTLSVLLVGCGRVQPIRNVENAPIAHNLPAATVKQAILQSGSNRGWVMTEIEPGVIRGELFVRSHSAVIDVKYSDKVYSIHYVDSDNLKYSDGKIHRNYNRWINNLDVDIRKKLSMLSASQK